VTLDLSSTIGPIRPKKKPKVQPTNEGTPATPATPAHHAQSRVATPDLSQPVSTAPLNGNTPDPPDEEDQDALEDTRIQILDLPSPNPIISYRNHIYDCRWTSTIGTDLLITAPSPDSELPKLVEGQGFDILAASSIKMVGQSAQLVPKPDARVSRNAASDELANPEGNEGGVKLPVGIASSKARQNQARFLERLINVKVAKGEQDAVTVHSQKRMTNSGWRVRQNRQRAEEQAEMEDLRRLAADGDEGASKALKELEARANESDEEAEAAADIADSNRGGSRGRARGRYGKQGQKRRALGGLFRDYRPADGDEEGADIRGMPATTPSTPAAVGPVVADDTTTTTTKPDEPIGAETEMPDAPL
jgi:hypothetical protein